ncbi:Protein unc-93-like protein A [Sciurus carolinensis]|uniref:Protein unc-93-like protein A n=1 Tax=Sciurus carolinensis TaxID=30640 RepID=A0AA41T2J5_SCICA|nr:Protein unc-93-like protein A [Sciurus carolinensis]
MQRTAAGLLRWRTHRVFHRLCPGHPACWMRDICSLLYGKLSQDTGRADICMLGVAPHLSRIMAPLLCRLLHGRVLMLPGPWDPGIADWQRQSNAVYGAPFEKMEEAAFTSDRLWEALGFILVLGYSSLLCVNIELPIRLGVLSLAGSPMGVLSMETRSLVETFVARQTGQAVEDRQGQ